ncbi:DMT family transporter [Staphylococcus massiliensis]|uniref:DMT family transporter n=1 Tax=Staphylococcus massiliensis TaxID=555791 RepID=UPI0030CBDA6C
MLIGGIGLSFIYPPWHMDYLSWSMMTIICFMISIVFGTMIAFWFYIESLNYISPQEAGVLGTIEPLMAILTSVLWLHVSFGIFQMVGVLCIIMMVVYLSIADSK